MASARRLPQPIEQVKHKAINIALALALAIGLAPGAALCTPGVAQAASKIPIEYIPEDSFTPEGFNWGISFTDVEIVRGFTSEPNIKQYYPRDYDELASPDDSGFAARIDRTTPKGSFALRYTGASYGNDKVDAVVTLSNWNYVEPVMSNGASGWDEYEERADYDTFQPGVFVNSGYQRTGSLIENLNFYTVGLTDLEVSVEFFYAGTDDPFEVKGHMTCIDLDVGQKFGFGGAVSLAQVVDKNDFLSIDEEQSIVSSPEYPCGGVEDEHGAISADPNDPLYKLGLVGAYFDTTGSQKGTPVKLSFVSSWRGSNSTAQSFFAMTNEFLTAPNPNDDIVEDGKLDVRKTADKTEGVSIGDVVTYTVEVPVHERGATCRNGYSYTDFEIVDVLPREMRYVDGSGYLADSEGQLIENAGEVVYAGRGDESGDGNAVKFAFSQSYLQHSMRMQGETYRFEFKAELTEYPADGALSVSNSAYARVNDKGTYPSNSVETTLVPPRLTVDKTADAYEYEEGEVVHFTASFSQSEKNAQCREAVFSDSLPEGLELIPETVQVTGLESLPTPSVEGNRWSCSLDKFNYGDALTVSFAAIATQAGNGTKQVNIATARANNCEEASDSAEVWMNTASLSIEKTADRYEHFIGASEQDAGAVVYTITVENTKEGTVANNVIVSDESLPEGLKIGRTDTGELAVDVSGIPESISYPVGAEGSTPSQLEQREITCSTKPAGTGFATTVSHLPAHMPVTITCTCYPEDSIAGWEIENTATVSADNATDARDSALTWINQPTLQVEKTASQGTCNVGDLVAFRVKVTNNTPGTIGRNLVVSDLLQAKGVELQQDSIKVWDSEGNDITDSCVISTDGEKPSFTIETNRNLVSNSPERTFYRFGEKAEQGANPLGEEGETAVSVDYTVAIADAALAGSTVGNIAIAATDEPNTQTSGDASITVKDAQLQVSKTSDEKRYEAGDIAHYTVTVAQTRESSTAHNVTFADHFESDELASIDASSLLVTGPDGATIDNPDVTLEKNEDGTVFGFSLQPGIDLRDGETLTVEYSAKLPIASEHVVNRAQAKASDAAAASAANDVEVGEPLADASLDKEASAETAQVGDSFTYTITARATNGTLRDAMITDSGLPSGIEVDLTSLSAIVNGKAIEEPIVHQEGSSFAIELGTMGKDDVAVVSFKANVADKGLVGHKVVNGATLTSPTLEGERTAQAVVDIVGPAGTASIEKTASAESVFAGETVSYALSVEVGETDLEDALLVDEGMPEGVAIDYATFVATVDGKRIEPDFASKDAQSFALKLGKVNAGSNVSIEYEALIEEGSLAGSTVENTVTIESPTLSDRPHSTARVVVTERPASKVDIELTKSVDRENAAVGERIGFTIEATAVGGAVESVLVADTKMPSGAPIDLGSIQVAIDGKPVDAALESDGNTFSAFIGTLEKGSTATITFAADIADEALAGTKFSNRAVLTSPSLEDARIAHAIVNVDEGAQPIVGSGGSTTKGKGLGKTGDELMGFALKMIPALMISAGAIGIGAGALALRKRKAGRR
ncbi:isopeptide-forming domain-containing fimbrial protein [uncultured Ellagibacter sp.]|uniref:isopeptide-forming domain-containing fimbrial protein n=1 Tax=uncultured Ellagibacter sp. TaxID=2137580 RepID=UPI0025EE4508|nr:isopeptide-forming domain-containing fimbrial protein [uncultured Ellagibacter sp.]